MVPFQYPIKSLISHCDIFQNAHGRDKSPTYTQSQEEFLWESQWLRNSRALPNWNKFKASAAYDQFIT